MRVWGHIGIYRDEEPLRPVTYFSRLPTNLSEAQVVLVDPMLATGNKRLQAVAVLKAQVQSAFNFFVWSHVRRASRNCNRRIPTCRFSPPLLIQRLNNVGYIVPGLGDAGDRYFGTG